MCNRMIRTQIQLTEEQASTLREMSILRREAGPSRDAIVGRAKNAAGRFASGTSNASTEHDKYLADAFGGR
jgi:hypothetical protein